MSEPTVEKKEEEKKSYWDMMINGIVRPPRAKYNPAQLGIPLQNICRK